MAAYMCSFDWIAILITNGGDVTFTYEWKVISTSKMDTTQLQSSGGKIEFDRYWTADTRTRTRTHTCTIQSNYRSSHSTLIIEEMAIGASTSCKWNELRIVIVFGSKSTLDRVQWFINNNSNSDDDDWAYGVHDGAIYNDNNGVCLIMTMMIRIFYMLLHDSICLFMQWFEACWSGKLVCIMGHLYAYIDHHGQYYIRTLNNVYLRRKHRVENIMVYCQILTNETLSPAMSSVEDPGLMFAFYKIHQY